MLDVQCFSLPTTNVGGGDGNDFLDGGFALHYFMPAVFAHRDVAVANGLDAKFHSLGAVGDELGVRLRGGDVSGRGCGLVSGERCVPGGGTGRGRRGSLCRCC